jgi:deoxycytidylate deaminase
MVHAEANAISNLIVKQVDWYTAYITHLPCATCAKLLWQNGIHEWYVPKGAKAHGQSEEDRMVYEFLSKNGLEVNFFEPDLSHLNQLTSSLNTSTS